MVCKEAPLKISDSIGKAPDPAELKIIIKKLHALSIFLKWFRGKKFNADKHDLDTTKLRHLIRVDDYLTTRRLSKASG